MGARKPVKLSDVMSACQIFCQPLDKMSANNSFQTLIPAYVDRLRYKATSCGASPLATWDSAKSFSEYSIVLLMQRPLVGVI